MKKTEALAAMDENMETALSMMASHSLRRTYVIHRDHRPSMPAVIPAVPDESMQGVRTLIRHISDVMVSDAVSMLVPVSITVPGIGQTMALVAGMKWRDNASSSVECLIRAVGVSHNPDGTISCLHIEPNGMEEFVNEAMDGVLSPVRPDVYSVAYARDMLARKGHMSPELDAAIDGDDDLAAPTVH